MNKSTGFPAPTLPPVGAAATAPPPPLLSPVARAVGGLAAPGLGAPPATVPLIAPSLPGPSLPAPGAPTLPANVRVNPPEPALDQASSPLPPGAAELTDFGSPHHPPPPAPTGSSWKSKVLALLLIVAFATVTYFAVSNSANDDSDGAVQPTAATVAPRATSPLVAPINDAEAVVEQINDNAVEEEILGELGLDPSGEDPELTDEVAVPPSDAAATGDSAETAADASSALDAPAFNYSVQRGEGLAYDVWVDAASGNRELFDGSTYVRVVDGIAYTSDDPAGSWREDAAFVPSDKLTVLGTVMMFDDVLSTDLLGAAAASVTNDESGPARYLFVDTEFAATSPELRAAWLSSWGFDPAAALITIDGLVDGMPDAAQPGEMLISIASTAEGIVTDLTIQAPALGETVSYRLLGTSNEPFLLGVPAPLSE